jgi:predicted ATPase/DNA-binding winged helix-turn-helix (wHTH) protein
MHQNALTFGPFRFLPQQRLLTRSGLPLRVGSRALDILAVLVRRPSEVVTKDEILAQVWPNTIVEENNLRVHITALRKILGEGHVGGRFIENVPGRGYSFVAPVTIEEISTAEPAPHTGSTPFNNLPGTTSEVIGRDAAIAALIAQLPHHRLISLTGSGGVGKTTVALAVAEKLAPLYEDAVAFIDLATVGESSQVPSAVASILGCRVSADRTLEDLLHFIAGRRMLLLLDNCEHVLSGCAPLAAALLKGARGTVMLVTSREPLRATGEWVYQLPPLALPPLSAASSIRAAVKFPAVRLFVDRACAALATFNPTDLDAPAIVDICNRLDGIPLAIELAAGRINSMELRSLASSLDASLNVLSQGKRTAVPRHQAMRALLDWSFQLLPTVEQLVLRRLGIFNGPFFLEAVRDVCTSDDAAADAVQDALMSLIAKSLVSADVGRDRVRYRLLDTTRTYARERLESAGELARLSQRHAAFYKVLVARAESEWETRPSAQWREEYTDQVGNLRSALNYSFSPSGDSMTGIAITVAAIPLWFQLSLVDECLERVLQALTLLDQANSRDDRRRMKLHAALGWPHMAKTAQAHGGATAWRAALEIARKLDDVDFQLRSLWGLWVDCTNCGRTREALPVAEEFRALAARADEPADFWIGERMLGATHHFLGDQSVSKRHLDRMLEFYVEPANRSHAVRFQFDQKATARVALARVLWLQGHSALALNEISSTVAYVLAIDHKLSLANVLAEAACPIALMAGELDLADHYIAMLQDQTRTQSLDVWSTYAECFHGESLIEQGQVAQGLAALQAGLKRLRRGGFLLFESPFLGALARGYLAAGHAADGIPFVMEALEKCKDSGEGWYVPELLRLQGELLLMDDPEDSPRVSESLFLRSVQVAHECGAGAWELRAAVSCARLYAAQNRSSEVRPLLGPLLERFCGETASRDVIQAKSLLAR